MNTLDPMAVPSPLPSSSSPIPPFLEQVKRGKQLGLRLTLHPGQRRTLNSKKRFILALAGWQSGKSEIGPLWLWREMIARGPGDYLIASPTFPLMSKMVLPIFVRLFDRVLNLGHFVGGKNIFTFSAEGCQRLWHHVPDDPPRVIFGHAADPESLESATVKAAWLDEAGQNGFRLASYETILGRLSIHQGRVLLTSRPYSLGWMKQLLWDPWQAAGRNHRDIDIINFRSIDNPAFSPAEYYRAKAQLPAWRFTMLYDGLFTRPAGIIYSSFDADRHRVPRFEIPPQWQRYIGLDFGGVNTVAVFFAQEIKPGTNSPTGRLIAYREYRAGDRSAAEHVYHLLKGEPRIPICAGGSKSEGQWRREFAAGGTVNGVRVPGLPIHGPTGPSNDAAVEVGINRVFAAHALNQILVFDDLQGYLDQKLSYSRELDELGEATEKIADKASAHYMDAERYIISYLRPDKPQATFSGTVVARPGLRNL